MLSCRASPVFSSWERSANHLGVEHAVEFELDRWEDALALM